MRKTACLSPVLLLLVSACPGITQEFDANATYAVEPVSAEIAATNNGASWDEDGSEPDVIMQVQCPGGQTVETGEAASLKPSWTSTSCTATGAALRDTGIVWQLWDSDLLANDSITASIQTRFAEDVIRAGEGTVAGPVGAASSIRFRVTKQ